MEIFIMEIVNVHNVTQCVETFDLSIVSLTCLHFTEGSE